MVKTKIEKLDKAALKCYHCGDVCNDTSIVLESKIFCCNGCKTVYELLDENSMCDYYSLENNPGNKVKETQEFAYLEDEKIKHSLLNFQEGDISAVTFNIPSIHCSSCIWLLENLHKIHSGIISASIQFQRKELDVKFNSTISLKQLAELLSSLGYAPAVALNGKEANNKSVNKSLYYKLGIAGFCFGNIMMLSLPEYLSIFDEFNGDIKYLFTYLNLLLALPVFFYSASDYFIASYTAIRSRIINIDFPIALGLIAAFTQSAYEIISGTGAGYLDSLTGLVFFLLIGKWYQKKTYESLSFERDYKSYFPLAATKIDSNNESFVALNELKVDDIILVRNHEIIPADGTLLDSNANIDYSFVTGESVPVSKKSGQQVFAGGKQIGAAIKVKVCREVSESYLTQLWNNSNSKEKFYGLTDFTNRIGKYFTLAVLMISGGAYWYWVGKDSSIALYAAVSVLIIFCPCIFALAIPFGFGNAMNILGRNGLFLKNTQTIEKLAANDTIVFDKTGTITSTGEAEIEMEGSLSDNELQLVKSLIRNSTHPLSRILYNYLLGFDYIHPDLFKEELSLGISGLVNGQKVKIGSWKMMSIEKEEKCLENSHARVYISINGEVRGYYKFKNKYRNALAEVFGSLKKSASLHLLSGDNDAERKYLSQFFDDKNLFFNQSPMNKLEYVRELEKEKQVLMIGDGLNDAGALHQSNCGIAISENSGMFSPACDAIMESSSFSMLPSFIKYAKACRNSVYWSLLLSLSYNIVGLYFAVQGDLKPLVAAILMPLSSVSVVLFVTLMTNFWAKRYSLK